MPRFTCREQFFEAARLQAQREFEADSTNAQASLGNCLHIERPCAGTQLLLTPGPTPTIAGPGAMGWGAAGAGSLQAGQGVGGHDPPGRCKRGPGAPSYVVNINWLR